MKKWYDDSFWHQDLIDIWTIPHSLFGVIVALVFSLWSMDMMVGLVLTFVVAVLWEIGEIITAVSSDETNLNKISDVFVATAFYGITWSSVYLYQPSESDVQLLFWIAASVCVGVSTVGWIGYYLWRRK
jgi:CDP-diglyceride synthetase